jgi:hypothetical protein
MISEFAKVHAAELEAVISDLAALQKEIDDADVWIERNPDDEARRGSSRTGYPRRHHMQPVSPRRKAAQRGRL